MLPTRHNPDVPKKITDDFNRHDGKAYSANEIMQIEKILAGQSDKKIKKNKEYPFSVIQTEQGKLYALYGDEILGKGAVGKVKFVQDLETGEVLCCKIQFNYCGQHEKSFLIKSRILSGILSRGKDRGAEKHYYIMPIRGQPVDKVMPEVGQDEKYYILYQVLSELLQCHANNIAHLDFVDSNILYDKTNKKVTIIDFEKSEDLIVSQSADDRKKMDLFLFMYFVMQHYSDNKYLILKIQNELFLPGKDYESARNQFFPGYYLSKSCPDIKNIKDIDFEKIFDAIKSRCAYTEMTDSEMNKELIFLKLQNDRRKIHQLILKIEEYIKNEVWKYDGFLAVNTYITCLKNPITENNNVNNLPKTIKMHYEAIQDYKSNQSDPIALFERIKSTGKEAANDRDKAGRYPNTVEYYNIYLKTDEEIENKFMSNNENTFQNKK